MSRNDREGIYVGFFKSKHNRIKLHGVDAYNHWFYRGQVGFMFPKGRIRNKDLK